MANRDLVNNLKPVNSNAPALRTATVLGAACDMQGFESVVARVSVGAFGDTQSGSVYIEAELQDSPDNTTYTAVPDANLIFTTNPVGITWPIAGTATGTFFQSKTTGASMPAQTYEVGYRGPNRYLKINLRFTGTHTNGTVIGSNYDLGNPDYAPATGNPT